MSQSLSPMSEAEYLAWSERQELTYEFDGVRPIAMNGGTIGHERVQRNLIAALTVRLRGRPCEPFGPNTRVPTGKGRYRFPDAVITCVPLDPAGRDVTDPVVIFEIMSDSTQKTDRGTKLVVPRCAIHHPIHHAGAGECHGDRPHATGRSLGHRRAAR